jgi:chorismate lyase/3-hydroxybenzoate synthase
VGELLGADSTRRPPIRREGCVFRITESPDFTLLCATHSDAASLDDDSLRLAVERLYASVGSMLRTAELFPLRLWNYLPQIRSRPPGGLSRYEVFNAGRFEGYLAWSGSGEFGKRLAAACAVGHRGDDLVVHVLAGRRPGTPVENPRQTPAYRYSPRYGPLPPCFSRATSLADSHRRERDPLAIIAGTASIVGEDARHPGDLHAQLREIHLNLACLSASISAEPSPCSPSGGIDERATARALSRYRDLRVYVVEDAHLGEAMATLQRTFPRLERLEIASADMCRTELLIEVEGIVSSAG